MQIENGLSWQFNLRVSITWCICRSGSSLCIRIALSCPLVTTRLFIIWVSLVKIILCSARAVATIWASSLPAKNRVSYPIILSHLASLPTLLSTINRGVSILPAPCLSPYRKDILLFTGELASLHKPVLSGFLILPLRQLFLPLSLSPNQGSYER